MTTSTKKSEQTLPLEEQLPRREDKEEKQPAGPPARKALIGVIVICVLGLADMIYLTHLHWAVHSDPDYHSFCAISAEVDCESVAASDYSLLFGVPISFWGILAYLALMALAAWSIRATARGTAHRGAGLGLLSVAAAGSLAFSATLGYISMRFIESLCIMCMVGYAINIGIAVAVGMGLRSVGRGPIAMLREDLSFLLARPKLYLSLGTAGALLAVLTILLYPTPPAKADGEQAQPEQVNYSADRQVESIAVWDGAPTKGPADAPVTIVEFTDYQCPFCKRTYRELEHLLAPYEGRYRLIRRHYPLDMRCNPAIPRPGNGFSCNAIRYSICADQQGKFWELNHLLFTSENPLAPSEVKRLAEQAGCDMEELDSCLESDLPDRTLSRDTADGAKLEIEGTPTFFINGQKVLGMPSPEVLEVVFDTVEESERRAGRD